MNPSSRVPMGWISKFIHVVFVILSVLCSACNSQPQYDHNAIRQLFEEPIGGDLLQRVQMLEVLDFGMSAPKTVLNEPPQRLGLLARKRTAVEGKAAADALNTLRICYIKALPFKPSRYKQLTSGALLASDSSGRFALLPFKVFIDLDTNSRFYWIVSNPNAGSGKFVLSVELDNMFASKLANAADAK